jgi:hypothetical protein
LGLFLTAFPALAAIFNVRDFGATGDGTTKDTAAFQKTLDTCAVSGGGDVLVPAEKYLIGSGGNTNTADDPVEGLLGSPTAKHLSFSNVRLNRASVIVEGVQVATEKPVDGLTLSKISGTAAEGISLLHARNVVLKDINVTGVTGPMLAIDDVTGSGREGAVKYIAPPAAKKAPPK